MRILLVHNYYTVRGGEDAVFENERDMLERAGHEVLTYTAHNKNINGFFSSLRTIVNMFFSLSHYNNIKETIIAYEPEIVHVHNYFPLISPSVFYCCKKLNIPVVHTLHNYRPICPTALLMHKGDITEKSITDGPWWTVKHKVYRESFVGTLFLALMISLHKNISTWGKKVDGFICLTNFAKDIYIASGWPENKIFVKPNFVPNIASDIDKAILGDERFAVFVGRLSEEKGIHLLLEAWECVPYKLIVIGSGPLDGHIGNDNPNVIFTGNKDKSSVLKYIKAAEFLVMASTWYEGLPMVLIEAFSQGTPVLVPALGGMNEVVSDGFNGIKFIPGDSASLSDNALRLFHSSDLIEKLGKNAFSIYLKHYSENSNLSNLISIYEDVILKSKGCLNDKASLN
jgi:glycosyltransferase involved in cell wall biosynthesis